MTPENQPEGILSDREKYHIPSDIIIDDFEEHLSIPNNLRIFFSAKFGTGKSYFLEEFFKEKVDEYEVIKLYPVNYSTASNNDIFELIKFDILFHLIMKRQETISSEIQLPELTKLQTYIYQKFIINGVDSNLPLISALSSLAEGNDIITKVIPLIIGIYLEQKKKYKEDLGKDSLDIADDFMFKINKSFKEYGDDEPITAIIKEALTKLSETKKTVLLIDDLDRLDPAHIFRILNIFGNHFSSSSGNKIYVNENKFGFDKVIFVGDKNNIESVFHYRYGEKADFSGYFTKYYSKRIYHFSIIDILTSNFDKLFIDYKLPIYRDDFEEIKIVSEGVKILLQYFISQGKINFREADKKRKYTPKVGSLITTTYGIVLNSLPYRLSVYFIDFFEGKETFLKILNSSNDIELSFNNSQKHFNIRLLEETVFYLTFNIRSFDDKDKYISEFPKKYSFEIDSFSDKSSYYINFQPLPHSNYPNIKIEGIYTDSKDLQNRINPVDIRNFSVSFKKLYLKFLNKYF